MSDSSMMSSEDAPSVSELDLALIEAMQVHPRASWRELGGQIGRSAVTARRHWQQLSSDGIAWLHSYAGPASEVLIAVVDVETTPSETEEVGQTLAAKPEVGSVYGVSGTGLLVLLRVANRQGLRRLLGVELGRTPGVRSIRSALATQVFREGTRWRLGALPPQPDRQPTISATQSAVARHLPRLLGLLDRDVRMTHTALGERLGVSEVSARRLVATATATDQLRLRVDVAQEYVGWPYAIVLRLAVPGTDLQAAGRRIAELATVRLCTSMIGGIWNLFVIAWVRQLEDATQLEAQVAQLSGGRIVDRSVILRPFKRTGHLLHPDGRHACPPQAHAS